MDVNTFQISNRRGLGDHISLENQFVVFDPDPDSTLFDSSRSPAAKTAGVPLHWADAPSSKAIDALTARTLSRSSIVAGRRSFILSSTGKFSDLSNSSSRQIRRGSRPGLE